MAELPLHSSDAVAVAAVVVDNMPVVQPHTAAAAVVDHVLRPEMDCVIRVYFHNVFVALSSGCRSMDSSSNSTNISTKSNLSHTR